MKFIPKLRLGLGKSRCMNNYVPAFGYTISYPFKDDAKHKIFLLFTEREVNSLTRALNVTCPSSACMRKWSAL